MLEFQEKRKIKDWLQSKPVILVLIIFVALAARGTWRVWQKEQESAANLALSEHRLAGLQDRKAALDAEIASLGTERGQEEEIRGKLGLAKPGESVTIITDVATSAPTTTPAESWWDRFVGFFQ